MYDEFPAQGYQMAALPPWAQQVIDQMAEEPLIGLFGKQPSPLQIAEIAEGPLTHLVSTVLEQATREQTQALREARLLVERLGTFHGVTYPADVKQAAADARTYQMQHPWLVPSQTKEHHP